MPDALLDGAKDSPPSPPPAGSDMTERLRAALKTVEDPEIPVSVLDMGLVIALDYEAATQSVRVQLTYTSMGCPAMQMIQEDIRAALLAVPGVNEVTFDVVWDPVWTADRLSPSARATMKDLGIVS